MALALLIAQLQTISAAELKPLLHAGKRPLVVHAWASWCAPCLIELPELVEGLRKREVDVLWVDLDSKPAEKLWRKLGRAPGRAVSCPEAAPLRNLDGKWEGDLPATWLVAPDGAVQFSRSPADLWKIIDRRGP